MMGAGLGRRFWRLTRNRHGRRLYEFLADRGIRVTKLRRYERSTAGVDAESVDGPAGIELACKRASAVASDAVEVVSDATPDDWVVTASTNGEVIGYLLVSHDRGVLVEPLERELRVDGAYVWRVFVDPAHRQRGIATALVERAVGEANRLGAERAVALVAVDNFPSKRVFEATGFEGRQVHSYYRLFALSHRAVRDC